MAEAIGQDGSGAMVSAGGRGVQPELTHNEFADIDYSAWDVGTEWTPLTDEDIIAAWTGRGAEPELTDDAIELKEPK